MQSYNKKRIIKADNLRVEHKERKRRRSRKKEMPEGSQKRKMGGEGGREGERRKRERGKRGWEIRDVHFVFVPSLRQLLRKTFNFFFFSKVILDSKLPVQKADNSSKRKQF